MSFRVTRRIREALSPSFRTISGLPSGRLSRAWLPWLSAAAILAWMLARISPAEVVLATRDARIGLFGIGIAAACGSWLVLESTTLWILLRRLPREADAARLSWREIRSARAASYLLVPIHWHLGRAGFALRLARARSVSLLDSTSALLLQQSIDVWLLTGCACLGLAFLPPSASTILLGRTAGGVFLVLSAVCLLLAWPAPSGTWRSRLREVRLLRACRCMRPADWGILVLLRTVHASLLVAVHVGGTAAFGLDLPLTVAMAAVPVIQTIGAIPITPGGLGTQQAAMLLLFADHGSESAILAFGVALPLTQMLIRFGIGLAHLPVRTSARSRAAGAGLARLPADLR